MCTSAHQKATNVFPISVTINFLRSRFSRGRPRFMAVPPELNVNSTNTWIINSALAAGLYPKILSVDVLKDGKTDLRTIMNNQSVAFHPSSINFGRRPRDFGVNHLCYFTLMYVSCENCAFWVITKTDAIVQGTPRSCTSGRPGP